MMNIQHTNNVKQSGAVSLFIVIFTALLVTTITISFMQIMVRDQQQASYGDLSESAYDSAVAGVEDAKRALLLQQKCRDDHDTSQRCNNIQAAIRDGKCTTLSSIFGSSADTETRIQQSEGDKKLEQAYTCVKITSDTTDFLGSIDPNLSSTLVPLRAKEDFDTVTISWSQNKTGGAVDLAKGTDRSLPKVGSSSWPANRPALLRAQLINAGGTAGASDFKLSDFDTSGFSNALFLYPSETDSAISFSLDGRRTSSNTPQLVKCSSTTGSGAYACAVKIPMSSRIAAGNEKIFLSLAAFYNPTEYKIVLSDSTKALDPVTHEPVAIPFDSVQPEVDSTGRANDLFRRVVSRVELEGAFNYPIAALETSGSLCKTFSVTTELDDYAPGACTP